jgi:uncharacterized Rmd1/YagE family protein
MPSRVETPVELAGGMIQGHQDERSALQSYGSRKGAAAPKTVATNSVGGVKSSATQKTARKTIEKPPTRTRRAVSAFRRKGRLPDYETWRGRIGVHLPVDEYDLKATEISIQTSVPGWEHANHYDLIRLWQRPVEIISSTEPNSMGLDVIMDAATPEIFIFSFGAVVFYNFPNSKSEVTWIEQHLSESSVYGNEHPPSAVDAARDDLEFEYQTPSNGEDATKKGSHSTDDISALLALGASLKFRIKHDVCQFVTKSSGEKLAVAFGVAKSSLLSYYEWTLQQTMERNSDIPEQLAKAGTIPMKKIDISKEIGRIFLVMHRLNLDSNLQDTPEEFWDDHLYETQYEDTLVYFDLSKRLQLINIRLGMLQDLHTVLNDEVRNQHNLFMEWIIIWLIVAFLVIEFYEVALRELDMLVR